MKKTIFLIFFCSLKLVVFSQSFKLFLSGDGSPVDSVSAQFYVVVTRVSDTVWTAKQYDTDHVMLTEGTYKDRELTIPNGLFNYYSKEKATDKNPNPLNYIKTTGSFSNGLKTGEWVMFYPDHSRRELSNYKNDKLNGLYEMYGDKSMPTTLRGYYVDNVKEGEWYSLSVTGRIFRTETLKDGKVVKRTDTASDLILAKPSPDFGGYIITKIKYLVTEETSADISISCTITKEGKLTEPHIYNTKSSPELCKRLLELVQTAPIWEPAYISKSKEKIDDMAYINIRINNGTLEIRLASSNGLMYQLEH